MPRTIVKQPEAGDIRHIASDDELTHHLKNIPNERLVVLYFSLPWCGSCQKMNPSVEALNSKYSDDVSFFQVNADKCPASARKHHVTKVPVFLLFNNRTRVDRVEGASPSELESKIRRNLADIRFQAQNIIPQSQPLVPIATHGAKMGDVTQFMDRSQCRCINDLTPTPFQSFIEGKKLVSGKGVGRMILVYAFKEKMVLHGFKIRAPAYAAPKNLRFFINLHKVLDFAVVSQMSSSQEINISETDIAGEHTIEFKGQLVGVQNLQIFVSENMTKNRKTEIDSLTLIGAPMSLTGYAASASLADSPSITFDSKSVPSDTGLERGISEYTQASPMTFNRAGSSGKNKKADLPISQRNR